MITGDSRNPTPHRDINARAEGCESVSRCRSSYPPDFRFITEIAEEFAFLLSSGNANTEAANAVLRRLRKHALKPPLPKTAICSDAKSTRNRVLCIANWQSVQP